MTQIFPKSRTGATEVAAELRALIQKNVLSVRDRLPSERILSENFGVSRGTIRDALNRLEHEGLVEIRPGSGTYVSYSENADGTKIITNARPLELIDTRFALEPHICRLAVLHGQENDFVKLETLLSRMEKHEDDSQVFSEADSLFHEALVDSTGNSLLIWIINQINSVRSQDQWSRMRKLTLNRHIIRTYNTQHRQIFDAIRERDPERAALLMKDHLETARRSLMHAAES